MSRLESARKGGYYPLPPELIPLLANLISCPHDNGRILDPCAGEGEALIGLADALGLTPCGNELHRERAEVAQNAILENGGEAHHFWNAGIEEMTVAPEFAQLLYLNPPFDHDGKNQRLETKFLKTARPWLATNGILLFVIPQRVLANRDLAGYLVSWWDDLAVFRHPDEHRHFNEVTVIGVHRRKKRPTLSATYEELLAIGKEEKTVPILGSVQTSYSLPEPTKATTPFYPKRIDSATLWGEIRTHGFIPNHLKGIITPTSEAERAFSPLTPLRVGHVAGMVSAGMLNGLMSKGDTHVLVKGQTTKELVYNREEDETGTVKQIIHTRTEHVKATVQAVTPDGVLHTIGAESLGEFLHRWSGQLAEEVINRYKPVYRFELLPADRAKLRQMNQKRFIPGTTKRGLFPAQEHAVAAVATRLRQHREAILCGTMGTGKTVMAPAIAQLIDARRALVLCPPHLMEKWKREIELVLPRARASFLRTTREIDAWMAEQEDAGSILFGIMKQTDARAGSGWYPTLTWGASGVYRDSSSGELIFSSQVRKRAYEGKEPKYARYACRYPLWGDSGASSYVEYKGDDRGTTPPFYAALRSSSKQGREKGENGRTNYLYQYCGVAQKGRPRRTMLQALLIQDAIKLFASDIPYDNPRAKWPLATYLLKRYKGRVDLLFADEAHEYKAGDSDQGQAFGRLCAACRKVVLLTGTIYGGKASTLFYLLYRSSPAFRQAYGYNEVNRWIEEYGILQYRETERPDDEVRSKQTGTKKRYVSVKELPGASPAIIGWLLERTVFLSLEDLGADLPPYREEAIFVDMSREMNRVYAHFAEKLRGVVRAQLAKGNKSLLGSYINALITWPDAPWRVRAVMDPYMKDSVIAKAEALSIAVGEAPKEAKIVAHIKRSVETGRKVLLLCQQTNTLDITPQWVELLSKEGIKAKMLRCEPSEREAWIARAEREGVQVIIAHPRSVSTGLDILNYPEQIWMGIEYSSYTIGQTTKRSWRIGQTQPVNVTFYVYSKTLQEQAILMIAKKLTANQQIDGEMVDEESLADLATDDGDLFTALARQLVGQVAESNVTTLADEYREAHDNWNAPETSNPFAKTGQNYLGYAPPTIEAETTAKPPSPQPPVIIEAEATAISADPTPSTEELAGMSTLFGVTKPTEADATAELPSTPSAEPTKPVKWTLADMIRAKNKK